MRTPKIAGSSVILRYGDRFVFELQKSYKWNMDETGRVWIGLGCIGGSIETGEGPLQALRREAREEIGVEIDILPAPGMLIVNTDNSVEDAANPEQYKGVAIQWYGDRPDYADSIILSYLGTARTKPVPEDLPGIILAQPRDLLRTLRESLTLAELRQSGIELISRVSLPDHAKLAPRGTAKRLFYLMEHAPHKLAAVIPDDWAGFFCAPD
ncbi:MAG TPA: hypothetical protein DDZ65_01580 [Firmicutes bacterium]|nr:hypothetical protein [Bacillota bacterium]